MGYYLFAILPNINILLTALLIIGAILILCAFVATAETDSAKEGFRFAKYILYVEIVLGLIHTFIPSQKQLAFIIAAPYIIENQQLQEAGKNSAEIIKLGTEYVKDKLTTATTKKGE